MADSNIPVRLIGQDGSVYQLMVTTLTMDVDRKIVGMPLPFSGSERVTYDGNLSTAMITLEGYITDDDVIHINSGGKQATAFIDYSYDTLDASDIPWSFWVTPSYVAGDEETLDDFTKSKHLFALDAGGIQDIYYTKSTATSGLDGGTGKYFIQVHDGTARVSIQQMATNTAELINNHFPAYMSATVVNSESGSPNCKVIITRVTIGESGNGPTPFFSGVTFPTNASFPAHQEFSFGADSGFSSGMSAGDRVMELYSILNNSVDDMKQMVKDEESDKIYWIEQNTSRYIIGLQIPFNSTQHATGGEKYKAMNFFMSSGWNDENETTLDKALPAGTDFNIERYGFTRTGIGGTIDKATFVQIGGEPIYQFNILFTPTNHII